MKQPSRIFPVEQLAYIAGLVDGEGYVTITKRSNKECKRKFYHTPLVVVSNTYKPLLEWCCDKTGLGSLQKRKRGGKYKVCWAWALWVNDISELVPQILPYLICKQEQAKILLDYIQGTNRPGRSGMTDLDWNRREWYYLRLRQLNAKGVTQEQASWISTNVPEFRSSG